MKYIILIYSCLLFSSFLLAQNSMKSKLSAMVFEADGYVTNNSVYNYKPPNPLFIPFMPVPLGSVPGLESFSDYTTNGNTLNQLYVNSDTVAISMTYIDSNEATNLNTSNSVRMIYNVSYNGGANWFSNTMLNLTSTSKSRFPDLTLVNASGIRTAIASGRVWLTPTLRAGGLGKDIALGVGIGIPYFVPGTGQTGNTDLFTARMSNGNLACIMISSDTLYFLTFNTTTNTFSPRTVLYRDISYDPNHVAAYKIAAGTGGNLTVAYNFINEPLNGGDPIRMVKYQTSTDYGTTWNPPYPNMPLKILENGMINGDSVQAWWNLDIVYRPGSSSPYIIFPTYDYTVDPDPNMTRRSWKIILFSPSLNGGNPIVVADWHNVPVLQNLNSYNIVTRIVYINGVFRYPFQVNSAVLSHPSIGFSTDGNTLYAAYSVTQTDTSVESFNYFDIWCSKSTNGGLNWSTPANVTNTQFQDEMYPVAARTGNDNGAKITYQSTAVPGCQNFGPSGSFGGVESNIIARVYQCYRSDILVGSEMISGEVPESFSLSQNYPNPFNPATKIRFSIPLSRGVSEGRGVLVKLIVYDILGREVTTLVNEQLQPGTYEVEWDGRNYTSGIYFYRIETEIFVDSKKMILVK